MSPAQLAGFSALPPWDTEKQWAILQCREAQGILREGEGSLQRKVRSLEGFTHFL